MEKNEFGRTSIATHDIFPMADRCPFSQCLGISAHSNGKGTQLQSSELFLSKIDSSGRLSEARDGNLQDVCKQSRLTVSDI